MIADSIVSKLLAGRNSGGRSLVLLACRYDGGPTRETYPDNVFLLTNKYYLGYILLLTITEALVSCSLASEQKDQNKRWRNSPVCL